MIVGKDGRAEAAPDFIRHQPGVVQVRARQQDLDQIAHRLLDKEVLDGDALRELVAADAPAARAAV